MTGRLVLCNESQIRVFIARDDMQVELDGEDLRVLTDGGYVRFDDAWNIAHPECGAW
jgi:hypothetical protein